MDEVEAEALRLEGIGRWADAGQLWRQSGDRDRERTAWVAAAQRAESRAEWFLAGEYWTNAGSEADAARVGAERAEEFEAKGSLKSAAKAWAEIGNDARANGAWLAYAERAIESGRTRDAVDAFIEGGALDRAAGLLEELGQNRQGERSLRRAADLWSRAGHPDRAQAIYERIAQHAESQGLVAGAAPAWREAGRDERAVTTFADLSVQAAGEGKWRVAAKAADAALGLPWPKRVTEWAKVVDPARGLIGPVCPAPRPPETVVLWLFAALECQRVRDWESAAHIWWSLGDLPHARRAFARLARAREAAGDAPGAARLWALAGEQRRASTYWLEVAEREWATLDVRTALKSLRRAGPSPAAGQMAQAWLQTEGNHRRTRTIARWGLRLGDDVPLDQLPDGHRRLFLAVLKADPDLERRWRGWAPPAERLDAAVDSVGPWPQVLVWFYGLRGEAPLHLTEIAARLRRDVRAITARRDEGLKRLAGRPGEAVLGEGHVPSAQQDRDGIQRAAAAAGRLGEIQVLLSALDACGADGVETLAQFSSAGEEPKGEDSWRDDVLEARAAAGRTAGRRFAGLIDWTGFELSLERQEVAAHHVAVTVARLLVPEGSGAHFRELHRQVVAIMSGDLDA